MIDVDSLTPKRIVEELDKYIVGQMKAKRAVAVALRNRYRRRLLSDELRDEVIPKNILMIGPTGVGKTEIARRLANLTAAPFIKIEATKFTEVGYVGRDVDSMIRDLVQVAVRMVENEKVEEVRGPAMDAALDKILDILEPPARRRTSSISQPWAALGNIFPGAAQETQTEEEAEPPDEEYQAAQDRKQRIRERLRKQLELQSKHEFVRSDDLQQPFFIHAVQPGHINDLEPIPPLRQ